MHRQEFPGGRMSKNKGLRGRKGESLSLGSKTSTWKYREEMREITIRGMEHEKQRSVRTTRQPMIY
jgi:hypothetical protein